MTDLKSHRQIRLESMDREIARLVDALAEVREARALLDGGAVQPAKPAAKANGAQRHAQ